MMNVILEKAGREVIKRAAVRYLVARGVSATLEDLAAYRAARREQRQKAFAEAFAGAVGAQAKTAIRRSLLPEEEGALESLRPKLNNKEGE